MPRNITSQGKLHFKQNCFLFFALPLSVVTFQTPPDSSLLVSLVHRMLACFRFHYFADNVLENYASLQSLFQLLSEQSALDFQLGHLMLPVITMSHQFHFPISSLNPFVNTKNRGSGSFFANCPFVSSIIVPLLLLGIIYLY